MVLHTHRSEKSLMVTLSNGVGIISAVAQHGSDTQRSGPFFHPPRIAVGTYSTCLDLSLLAVIRLVGLDLDNFRLPISAKFITKFNPPVHLSGGFSLARAETKQSKRVNSETASSGCFSSLSRVRSINHLPAP